MLNSVDTIALDGIRRTPLAHRSERQSALLDALEHMESCADCDGSGKPCEKGSVLLGAAEETPEEPPTCCALRRKIVVGVVAVLPAEVCGVPDSEMADVVSFHMDTPSGLPVIALRYCPWCGLARKPGDEVRIFDPGNPN